MQSELYSHKRETGAKLRIRVLIWVIVATLGCQDLLEDVSGAIHGGLPSQGLGQSISDANLMFEFLLGGVEIDKDNNIILLDMEMASMRQGRAFLAHINDNIPKTFSSMEQMVKDLEDKRGPLPLSQPRFESLILGMVYSAHQVKLQEREKDQEKWGEVLIRLANITVNELRRQETITIFP
ncbi:protein FAM180A [Salmo salar]|uniref:Protein FAM180A n=1 Tax=Salmo salar TaxID=8030 RepID=A0A1S3KTF0_SALSA|nr:protein FAM180A [Salmo salar]|eukprot:XP_013981584.1 PREDICTED: protein FAM180A-like [Salmo salar]